MKVGGEVKGGLGFFGPKNVWTIGLGHRGHIHDSLENPAGRRK